MSTEFKREERYLIFKLSDVEDHFTPSERQQLARLAEVQRVGRSESGKPLLECVVVEADWPEYEPTWNAIETRVTGAKAQPAPKAVAYLDLGLGGYMDIGTDLTDEELATLPKGRHMLGVIGTYGVDGYVPAQPAPSVPEGWIQRGMAELEAIRNRHDDDTLLNDRTLIERIGKAMLAAAPEAKP